jgi:cold shock CspA family protein
MSETDGTTQVETPTQPIQVGSRTGQVKAFNAKKGYGFISVHGETDMDVFVHQTNINPLRSTYRTLTRGEYVSFDISDDDKNQALNVRGVGGGTLRCDAVSQRRPDSEGGTGGEDEDTEGFTTVNTQRRNQGGRGRGNGRGRGRGRGNGNGRPRGPRVENGNGESPSQTTMADFLPSDIGAGADAPVAAEESA